MTATTIAMTTTTRTVTNDCDDDWDLDHCAGDDCDDYGCYLDAEAEKHIDMDASTVRGEASDPEQLSP